ncbi:hypothetical protein ACOMHN_003562 [Nucella lapillus]
MARVIGKADIIAKEHGPACPFIVVVNVCHRAVGSPLVMDPNSVCRKSRRLVGKQRKLCRKEPEIVKNVAKGAQLALLECHFQFRQRRWNCTARKRSISRIWKTGRLAGAVCACLTGRWLFSYGRQVGWLGLCVLV